MPVTPIYPCVYIEEIPSGERPIKGLNTSVAAFIGYFTQCRIDKNICAQ